ncbi:MAG TPA: zinc ribbon domain-containing protein [Polyangiaceae bacterium]|jgi:hypothetical protein|nr:zinc ribbon domain-containing protein [Polyangiaceae bacterium]
MAEEARTFCPHCYAPVIQGRKTCPKCGRNVSDAPPASRNAVKHAAGGSATFAALGLLVLIVAVAAWVLLK